MNVSLTPELEQLVNQKVTSGLYHSASEVIREALRLLKEQDEIKQSRLLEIRREVALGLAQLKRGEGVAGEEVFAELREKSHQQRQKGKKR